MLKNWRFVTEKTASQSLQAKACKPKPASQSLQAKACKPKPVLQPDFLVVTKS
jgi:hypothetical protein